MFDSVLDYLCKVGAVWQYTGSGPHAIYSLSELHTNFYFNSTVLNASSEIADTVVKEYLSHLIVPFVGKTDLVCSYLPYGAGITKAIAKQLNCREVFLESLDAPDLPEFVEPNHRVLMVVDEIYSGGSLRILRNALQERSAKICESIVVVGNFSGSRQFEKLPIISAFELSISRWIDTKCPLCANGSQALQARIHWEKFVDKKDNN